MGLVEIQLLCFTSLLSRENSVRKIFCGNTCHKSWVADATSFWATCKPLIAGQTTREAWGRSTHQPRSWCIVEAAAKVTHGTWMAADTTTQILVHYRRCSRDISRSLEGGAAHTNQASVHQCRSCSTDMDRGVAELPGWSTRSAGVVEWPRCYLVGQGHHLQQRLKLPGQPRRIQLQVLHSDQAQGLQAGLEVQDMEVIVVLEASVR